MRGLLGYLSRKRQKTFWQHCYPLEVQYDPNVFPRFRSMVRVKVSLRPLVPRDQLVGVVGARDLPRGPVDRGVAHAALFLRPNLHRVVHLACG